MSSGVVGSTIGEYRIESELGRGGMAVVYRAAHLPSGYPVALKLLAEHFSDDADLVRRFERDPSVVRGLSHPAIVPIIDSGRHNGRPYLVMPLLDGGTLADRLANSPLPPAQIVAVLTRVAGALDVAHAAGLVHRDVKPSNILFDAAGAAYLADFGIVKVPNASRKLTRTGTSLGTPEYMSPEQFDADGPDGLTGLSDLYALGVVLFEMLTGRAPFQATSPLAIIRQHHNEPPPRLCTLDPSLPAGWQPVLDRALAKQPAARYPSGAALALAAAAVATAPPPAPRPTVALRRAVSLRRVGAALGGAALLVALLTLLIVPVLPPRRAAPTAVVGVSTTPALTATRPALTSTPAPSAIVSSPTAGVVVPSPTAGPPGARLLAAAALRAGPGANFDALAELPAEATVIILGRDTSWGWYNVRAADGRAGWLPRTAVALLDPSAMALIPPAATLPAPPTVPPTAGPSPTLTFLPLPTTAFMPAPTALIAAPNAVVTSAVPANAVPTAPPAAEPPAAPPTARPPRPPTPVPPTPVPPTPVPPTPVPPTPVPPTPVPPTGYPYP